MKKKFLPDKNIAPISMSIAVFAFIFAFVGIVIILVGQKIFISKWLVNIGIIILFISLAIMTITILYHFFWIIKKILNIFANTDKE